VIQRITVLHADFVARTAEEHLFSESAGTTAVNITRTNRAKIDKAGIANQYTQIYK
jgi:hypothetical protein